jgi:hypothetical protein
MAATNRYSIYPSQFVGGSTLTLRQIHNVRVVPNSSKDVIIPGGAIDPEAIPNMFAQPMVTFSTHDLAAVLTAVSITAGLNCTSGGIIQFQQRVDGGTFGGTGVHTKLTSTKGWLGLQSITASQDGPAEANLAYYPLFDGTNDPLTADAAASLTSSPLYATKFSLGTMYANDVAMSAIQSLSINTGINYQVNRESGDVYARTGSIITRAPTISFTSFYMGHADISNFLFNASIPGTTAAYFRKMLTGGARVADATTEHVKISAATGVWSMDSGEASDNGDATLSGSVQIIGSIAESHASAIP